MRSSSLKVLAFSQHLIFNPARNLTEIPRIRLVLALVVHHLQNQLNLIYILYELAFQSLAVLLFPDIIDFLARDPTVDFSKQAVREVIHGCFFSSVLLMLCDFIHR